MSDVEHLSCVCYVCLLWRNVCLVLWLIFDWVVYFSGIELQELLVYFLRLILCPLLRLLLFSPILKAFFSTLLIISFVVQKLLSLIRSHLIIFVFFFSPLL